MITTISFVRHGEVHNPKQIYYGRLPRFRLSESGVEQAGNAGIFLSTQNITAIYSSPLLRARQTAGQIAAKCGGLPVHISSLLLEVNSPYDGRTHAEMLARDWDFYSNTPPEFEQPNDIVARTTKFIRIARQKYAGKHVVAVFHADPFAFTALWAAGQPLAVAGRKQLRRIGFSDDYPDYASILQLTFASDRDLVSQIRYIQTTLVFPNRE